jgi:hypothetical protein
MTEAGSYQSHIKEFKIEDVSFIDSSTAKSIDDDLMFNDGSKSCSLRKTKKFDCSHTTYSALKPHTVVSIPGNLNL